MEQLKMHAIDYAKENVQKVAQLFPNCVTETANGLAIDFEKLQQELSEEVMSGSDERYQFTWPGKRAAIREANSPCYLTLRPSREDSVDFDKTKNLYIEGDNLQVLKLLRESYLGKVKMIYIDPPYNTGKDFVYHDNFHQSISEYQEQSSMFDEEGNMTLQEYEVNSEITGRYHSDWLNMMYPRLKLAKDFLTEDGAIFISIDDNEVENLKKICNEIFGEENLQATLNVQVRYGDKSLNEEKAFKPLIEYVLVYSKNNKLYNPNRPQEEYGLDGFVHEIKELSQGHKITINGEDVIVFKKGEWEDVKHSKGNLQLLKETWISGSVYTNMSYGKVYQKIVEPRVNEDGLGCLYKILGRGEDGLGFRYYTNPQKASANRGKMFSGVPKERVEEISQGNGSIKYKPILCYNDYSADFGNIRHEGGIPFNSGKKPIKMLSEYIKMSADKDIIIMDFFSGSASTAHACMAINSEDNGTRQFIMVQIPELIEPTNELYKQGFRTICELGEERIRRAGKELIAKKQKSDLDTGFRVLKLASSNMNDVFYNPQDTELQNLFAENIKSDRTPEDLLFQVLPELNLPLSAKIETKTIAGKQVFVVEDNYLAACFDEDITDECITAIAKTQPYHFVMRESGAHTDQVLDNFDQLFKAYSPKTTTHVM